MTLEQELGGAGFQERVKLVLRTVLTGSPVPVGGGPGECAVWSTDGRQGTARAGKTSLGSKLMSHIFF